MINEETCQTGQCYFVAEQPQGFAQPNLVGQMGKCKWKNYRGACIAFENGKNYIIPYNCLSLTKQNYPRRKFRDIPTPQTCVTCQYRYRMANFNKMENIPLPLLGRIGTFCQVLWTADNNVCEISFDDGNRSVVYLSNLEDIGA